MDGFIVFFACSAAVGFRPVRQEGTFFVDIYFAEQVLIHKVIVALVVVPGKPFVFIQVYGCHLGEIQIPLVVPFYKVFVSADRAGACSKP